MVWHGGHGYGVVAAAFLVLVTATAWLVIVVATAWLVVVAAMLQ